MAGKMFLTMTDIEQKKVGDALAKSLPKTVNAEVKKTMIQTTHGARVREAQRERLKGQVPKVEDMFNAPAKRLASTRKTKHRRWRLSGSKLRLPARTTIRWRAGGCDGRCSIGADHGDGSLYIGQQRGVGHSAPTTHAIPIPNLGACNSAFIYNTFKTSNVSG